MKTIRSIFRLSAVGAVALASGSHASAIDPSLHDEVARNAFFPVQRVDFRRELEHGDVATVVHTPFGATPTKPAQFVADRFDWEHQRIDTRAPRALYDLDFSTKVEVDPEAATPVETSVLLSSGSVLLSPGPDLFVFCAADAVSGVRVAPLLRTPDGRFAPGQAIEMDSAAHLGRVSEGVFGFGIDIDAWINAGLIPGNATLMGVVIMHDGQPGSGSLAIIEIVGGDSLLFSEGGGTGGGGGASGLLSLGSGGYRGSGGGGGGEPRDGEDEIPSPGAGLLLGLGLAAAAARRRR